MKVKPFVTVTLFIFWAITAAVLTTGLVFYDSNRAGLRPSVQIPLSGNGSDAGQMQNVVLSTQEIAKHNTASSCWMIFSGKVYDVTSVISAHPGGPGAIIAYCGKDGTQAFQTKGGRGRDHSASAYSWLDQLFIGNVGQSVSGSAVQNVQQTASPANQQYGGGEYGD